MTLGRCTGVYLLESITGLNDKGINAVDSQSFGEMITALDELFGLDRDSIVQEPGVGLEVVNCALLHTGHCCRMAETVVTTSAERQK